MKNNKILCILQARMWSTRLPGKILKKIKKKTLIEYEIDRIKRSKYIDKIVIATSKNQSDDILEILCKKININCYRWEEEDVLKRFFDCSNKYNDYNIIVRLTWDCPLIDPEIINKTIEKFLKSWVDYCSNIEPETFPDWLDVEVFTKKSLENAYLNAKLPSEREHVTPFIRKHSSKTNYANPINYSNFRLTVDEKEDFDLIKTLIEKVWPDKWYLDYINHTKQFWLDKINNKFKRNEGFQKSSNEDKKFINNS